MRDFERVVWVLFGGRLRLAKRQNVCYVPAELQIFILWHPAPPSTHTSTHRVAYSVRLYVQKGEPNPPKAPHLVDFTLLGQMGSCAAPRNSVLPFGFGRILLMESSMDTTWPIGFGIIRAVLRHTFGIISKLKKLSVPCVKCVAVAIAVAFYLHFIFMANVSRAAR